MGDEYKFNWEAVQETSRTLADQQAAKQELLDVIKELRYCLDYLSDECGIEEDPDIDVRRINDACIQADVISTELSNTFITGTGQTLSNTHTKDKCANSDCVIHNPSIHNMVGWPTHWRDDEGFMERICEHGVGHPDPDEMNSPLTHGCDGCCSDEGKVS